MTLFLDDAQVRRLLRIDALFDATRQALIALSAGRVIQPVRMAMDFPAGVLFLKPALIDGALATKLITQCPGNAARGLPTMQATLVLFCAETGSTLAVMDGTWITALRTAVVSAIGADALTSHAPKVLALLGSGVLARSHVQAMRQVRRIDAVRVWSPNPRNAARCADEVGGVAAASAQEAVEGADIVCTVTTATEPVLKGAWLKPGAFVAAVGAPRPHWRELDDAVMQAYVVVDSREAAQQEAGDVILSGARVRAEIGAILAGTEPPPPAGTTVVFKALGQAVEDAVAARLVYAAATTPGSSPPTP